MRILFITNSKRECGVAEFGRQHTRALEELGHQVEVWCPGYEYDWPRGIYAGTYDVVHYNYHPGTINHLRPPVGYGGALVSAYFHEPLSDWGFGKYDCGFEAEQSGKYPRHLIPMPVPDYESTGYRRRFLRAGTSSLRQAGVDWVAPVLKELRIEYDHGQHKGDRDGWVTTAEEIDRLNACDFLVYWYPGANAGQSAGLTMAIAAQRPILLNHNRMFASVEGFDDELYFADDLKDGILRVTHDLRHGIAKIPRKLKRERGWRKLAGEMVDYWKIYRERRG